MGNINGKHDLHGYCYSGHDLHGNCYAGHDRECNFDGHDGDQQHWGERHDTANNAANDEHRDFQCGYSGHGYCVWHHLLGHHGHHGSGWHSDGCRDSLLWVVGQHLGHFDADVRSIHGHHVVGYFD